MSSEEGPASGEETVRPIQTDLEEVYRRYQQSHLYETLDEVADTMETILLRRRIANQIFESNVDIDEETRSVIDTARKQVGTDDLDRLEEMVEETQSKVDQAKNDVDTQIHEIRTELLDTVRALVKLNEEIEAVDPDCLESLQEFLEDRDWYRRVGRKENGSLEDKLQEAEELGVEMREILDEARGAIGDEFEGSDIQNIVEELLESGGISFTDLTPEQRTALAESELGDHIELSLG